MKNLIAAVLILALLPATTFAGGGSKNSTAISIKNGTTGIAAVIVDYTGTDAQLAALTQAQFTAAGGFLLNAGESKKLTVKAGSHVVKAAFANVTNGSVAASDIGTKSVTVVANKTLSVTVTGSTGAPAVIN